MVSSQIQQWALTLGAFKHTIRHKPESKMAETSCHLYSTSKYLILLTNHLCECIFTANFMKHEQIKILVYFVVDLFRLAEYCQN